MKITVDHNIVEFSPESEQEAADLNALWQTVVDCDGNHKKIVPMGNFMPGVDKLARFNIEAAVTHHPSGVQAEVEEVLPEDATFYCAICNKYTEAKAGEPVPTCCGQVMEMM